MPRDGKQLLSVQAAVLQLLARTEPQTMAAIAQALGFSGAGVHFALKKLREAGAVKATTKREVKTKGAPASDWFLTARGAKRAARERAILLQGLGGA